MAYLVPLKRKCAQCKTAWATVEVFNRYNAAQGQYCRPCGIRRVKELDAAESTPAALRHWERGAAP